MNVTRYGQSYGRLNRTQIGSDRPNGSLGLESVHTTQGMEAQGSGAGGPMRMRQSAGVSETGSKPNVTITESEDEDVLDELEARLTRMVARRNRRRYVDINKRSEHETKLMSRGKYNAL